MIETPRLKILREKLAKIEQSQYEEAIAEAKFWVEGTEGGYIPHCILKQDKSKNEILKILIEVEEESIAVNKSLEKYKMKIENNKVKCLECGWIGIRSDLLIGKSPFEDCEVYGCPKCKEINSAVCLCDEIGCELEVVCGTPTKSGVYRNTCSEHQPKELDRIK